jgi:hypothetical protein
MHPSRLLWIPLALLLASGSLAGQNLVVTRPSNIRRDPSSQHTPRGHLMPGDAFTLLSPDTVNGYLHGHRPALSSSGWVWARNVRIVGDTTPQPVVAAAAYDGCPLIGSAKSALFKALNPQKNRSKVPTNADIDHSVTLSAMLAPGDDHGRFDSAKAAEIVGFVFHAKPGGKETTNCGVGDPRHRDTHIEIVASPTDTLGRQRVIVEVTPRWRAAELLLGNDWSTANLHHSIEGEWVRVRGWLFFDVEHSGKAENTAPGNPTNWRATAWELHPVTSIQICALAHCGN